MIMHKDRGRKQILHLGRKTVTELWHGSHTQPSITPAASTLLCGKVELLFASALTLAFGVNHPVESLTNENASELPSVWDRC